MAFYQAKVFGAQAFSINYYSEVLPVQQVYRWELFPDELHSGKGTGRYHKLTLGLLRPLPQPIYSRRRRRIVFIPTTWQKFVSAVEINDLYDESPLEDRLLAKPRQLSLFDDPPTSE